MTISVVTTSAPMLARPLGRGEAVVRMARADRVGDPLHRVARLEQAGDGLQDADVRLAAGDDERVAAGRQAAQEAFLGRRREVELGERRVAERGDLGHERAEPVRVLLGADDVDAELARRRRELDAAAHHHLAVVDRRHQPRLRIDDQQRALVGLAENGSSPRLLPGSRHSAVMRAGVGTIGDGTARRDPC